MSEVGPRCANCQAAITGAYCAACGQRVAARLHSLGHFIAETFEAITHADSRLWRTLVLLLVRPGYLTREFFAGRRARYLPPARLYLVVSVVFFVVLSFGDSGTRLEFGSDVRSTFDELERGFDNNPDAARAVAEQRDRLAPTSESAGGALFEGCALSITGRPAASARLQAACDSLGADDGQAFLAALADNIPLALVLLLPLLAAVMKLLHRRSGRYYVEHLLLLTHNHAAAFLALLVYTLLVRFVPQMLHGWFGFALTLYLGWYSYRALRTTYDEGRAVALAKLGALAAAYGVFGVLLLVATIIFSALTL